MKIFDYIQNFIYDTLNYFLTGLIFVSILVVELTPIILNFESFKIQRLNSTLSSIDNNITNLKSFNLWIAFALVILLGFLFFSVADLFFRFVNNLIKNLNKRDKNNDTNNEQIIDLLKKEYCKFKTDTETEEVRKILENNNTTNTLLKKLASESKHQSKFVEWYKFKEHFFKILCVEFLAMIIIIPIFSIYFIDFSFTKILYSLLNLLPAYLLYNHSNYYKNRHKNDIINALFATYILEKRIKSNENDTTNASSN